MSEEFVYKGIRAQLDNELNIIRFWKESDFLGNVKVTGDVTPRRMDAEQVIDYWFDNDCLPEPIEFDR